LDLAQLFENHWVLAGVCVALGMLLGGGLVTLLSKRPSKTALQQKLDIVQTEFEAHKETVNDHFVTTSELVNELTESYVKVYKHLSDGAAQLSGGAELSRRLTLDETSDAESVIEGAVKTTSDEAVEETLAELEQTARDLADNPAATALPENPDTSNTSDTQDTPEIAR
jgi:uncharacterized membrane-anchored protein YhcB (DUF1043 family)